MPLHSRRVRPLIRTSRHCLTGSLFLLAACSNSGGPTEPPPTGGGDGKVALAFVASPGRAEGQVAFTPALEVEARDQAGGRLTSWSGSVTLSLKQNPGAATLGGTLTRKAENGVARFDDLTIDAPGTGYTLLASSGALATESLPFDVGLTMAMVSAGRHYTCGVTRAGKGYCWGRNDSGEHGTGERGLNGHAPRPIAGGHTFSTLSAGQGQTCGVTTAGKAYCWGMGNEGELGIGETVNWKTAPVAVAGGVTFTSLSTAFRYTCGVTTEGQAYCWGYGGEGQLGTGATGSSLVPVAVAGGLQFAAVNAGDVHSCGTTTTSRAYCWGWGANGMLGNGSTEDRHQPAAVDGDLSFASVQAGNLYSCGLTDAGKAYCWGAGGGPLGNGDAFDRHTPTPVAGNLTFTSISTGGHACGVTSTGQGYCWGSGLYGKLGHGGTGDALVPAAVAGNLSFTAISVGNTHACGVTQSGEAYCWGDNSTGQLGTGTVDTVPNSAPVLVYGTKH